MNGEMDIKLVFSKHNEKYLNKSNFRGKDFISFGFKRELSKFMEKLYQISVFLIDDIA